MRSSTRPCVTRTDGEGLRVGEVEQKEAVLVEEEPALTRGDVGRAEGFLSAIVRPC